MALAQSYQRNGCARCASISVSSDERISAYGKWTDKNDPSKFIITKRNRTLLVDECAHVASKQCSMGIFVFESARNRCSIKKPKSKSISTLFAYLFRLRRIYALMAYTNAIYAIDRRSVLDITLMVAAAFKCVISNGRAVRIKATEPPFVKQNIRNGRAVVRRANENNNMPFPFKSTIIPKHRRSLLPIQVLFAPRECVYGMRCARTQTESN